MLVHGHRTDKVWYLLVQIRGQTVIDYDKSLEPISRINMQILNGSTAESKATCWMLEHLVKLHVYFIVSTVSDRKIAIQFTGI